MSYATHVDRLDHVKGADEFLEATDRVEQAAQFACTALEDVIASLEDVRADRRAGRPMSELSDRIVHGAGRQNRYRAAAALRNYERSIMELRALIIRGMIDDEGLRLTDVARRLEISRQMVSRLYHSTAEDEAGATGESGEPGERDRAPGSGDAGQDHGDPGAEVRSSAEAPAERGADASNR